MRCMVQTVENIKLGYLFDKIIWKTTAVNIGFIKNVTAY